MARWYHDEIRDIFGDDLDSILGPRANRRPIAHATDAEIKNMRKCIRKFNEGVVFTNNRKILPFLEALRLVLNHFRSSIDPDTNKPVLFGWDFAMFDPNNGVKGIEWHLQLPLMLNYDAQRNIDVLHLFNLLIDFDPQLAFGAKGRKTSQGELIINDGQHGSLVLALVGSERIPAIYIESNLSYVDHNHFIGFNGAALQANDHDNHRNMVHRACGMLAANLPIKHEDQIHYDLHQILNRESITLVPPRGKTPGNGESKHTTKFLAYFDEYNQEVFKRAIRIMRSAWPTKSVPHEPLWGLCKLLSAQLENDKNQLRKIDTAIAQALAERWNKPEQVWPEVNLSIKQQYPLTKYRDAAETNTGNRGYLIGAAIKSTVENFDLYLTSQPGSPRGLGISLSPVKRDDDYEFYLNMPFMSSNGDVFDINDSLEFDEEEEELA